MEDKDDISIKLEKQNLIREEIINKGYDSIQFIEYLIQCKGPGGENINIWSIEDLKNAIKDFVYLNKNKTNINKIDNKIENKIENKKEEINIKPINKSEIPKHIGISINLVSLLNLIDLITDDIPNINNKFAILLPTIFPIAISG